MWNILLVEDEPFFRKRLMNKVNWEEYGFTICGEASNGEEGLEKMQALKPDVVISDIMMPVSDGIELLRRARNAGMESRFIMLTCMNEFEYARQAIEYGASGYLLKLSMSPVNLREVLQKVSRELHAIAVQQKDLSQVKFEHAFCMNLVSSI